MSKRITKKEINRKAPLSSAKLFDIGTKKLGQNGLLWTIVSYNGIKRWVSISKNLMSPITNNVSSSKINKNRYAWR